MRRFADEEFSKLIELIYDAAVDPGGWQTFLDALPTSFGGANGILHFCLNGGSAPRFLHFGWDPAYQKSYVEYFGAINPYPLNGLHRLEVARAAFAEEFLPTATVEETEFYNDWMRPQGITPDHLGMSLYNDGDHTIALSVAPHASVFRRDREGYRQKLQMLAPHLLRAAQIGAALEAQPALHQANEVILDRMGLAALVVTRNGVIIHANRGAQALLKGADRALSINRSGHLCAANSSDDAGLQSAISGVGYSSSFGIPVRLVSLESGAVFLAWALPINKDSNGTGVRASLAASLAGNQPKTLLILRRLNAPVELHPEAIAAAFSLTGAEGRLVSRLIAGQSIIEIATETGVSRNTLRNQLSSVFVKTGTRRQGELIAKIVSVLTAIG